MKAGAMTSRRVDLLLALASFAAALLLRLAFRGAFDGLYGQDAYAYYDFAGALGEALAQGQSPPPFFWSLGYPALLLGAFSVFGMNAAVAQALSLLAGAGVVSLTYVLARQAGAACWSALLAGALVAVCGQAVQSSLVVMADIPALFWALLGVVCLGALLSREQPAPRLLLLAVMALALAGLTRWLYLVLLLPAAAVLWAHARQQLRPVSLLLVGAGLALIVIPQLVFSLNSPYPTFNHAWVVGWSPANALRQSFVNVDGSFQYAQVNALFYAAPFYEAYYQSPLWTPLLLVGTALLLRRRAAYSLLLLGWALLPYLFLAGIPYQNIRFALICVPPVAVIVALGAQAAHAALIRMLSQRGVLLAGLLLAALSVAGIGHTLTVAAPVITTFITNQQRDKDVAAWLAGRLPSGAVVYTFGLTLTLEYYTDLQIIELFYETPETLVARPPGGYLLLNVWQIENQWAGLAPQIAYRWLRDVRGLTPLERFGNYTLFRIEQ